MDRKAMWQRVTAVAFITCLAVWVVACAVPSAPTVTPTPDADLSPQIAYIAQDWETDWTQHTVPLSELFPGGPPRDGIQSIDAPVFEPLSSAREWLSDQHPVMVVSLGGTARAYPLGILIRHEIVNDTMGSMPIAVTYCPLCNSAIVFERTVGGQVLEFGTSGLLRHSDLVMYDRLTETLWQQASGEAIAGAYAGKRLTFIPSQLVSLGDFAAAYPNGRVLARESGSRHPGEYGVNVYRDYDTYRPTRFRAEPDPRLEPMTRVLGVIVGDEAVAYPFDELRQERVVHDTVGSQRVVVFWQPGTVSALDDEDIDRSRDVGAAAAYRPTINGQPLTFTYGRDGITDAQTGSTWSLLGQAVEGPMAGTQLDVIQHHHDFWFAWAAFHEDTTIYEAN